MLYNYLHGELPISEYGIDYMDIIENSKCLPYNVEVNNYKNLGDIHTFDYKNCYLSMLLFNTMRYNLFSSTDKVVKYDGRDIDIGEYYINKDIYLDDIKIKKGWHVYVLIDYCLKENILTKDNIKKMIIPSNTLRCDLFKELIEKLLELKDEIIGVFQNLLRSAP